MNSSVVLPGDNAAAATTAWVRALGIPISDARIRTKFREHRRPTSLSAIVDTLAAVGLEARVARVPLERIPSLSLPVLVHLREQGFETFAVLHGVSPDSVVLADPISGRRVLRESEFAARATGLFALLDPPPKFTRAQRLAYAVEQGADRILREISRWGIGAVWGGLALAALWSSVARGGPALADLVAMLLLGEGIVGSVLAGWTLTGAGGSSVWARLCTLSDRFDCRSVLFSPQSRLGGRWPYSFLTVGFSLALFSLVMLANLLPSWSAAAWGWSAFFLTLSLLPAISLSIQQARVLRRWCLWCMACHGANLLAIVPAWIVFMNARPSAPTLWILALLLFALIGAVSLLAYQLILEARESRAIRDQWIALSSHPAAVVAAYQAGPRMVVPEGEHVGGGLELVLFSDPFCARCPKIHDTVESFAKRRPNVRRVHRLVSLVVPDRLPDFLDSRRPVERLELEILLHAVAIVRGESAFHEALAQVFREQAAFRRSTPAESLSRLGLEVPEIRPALVEAHRRFLRDAEWARRNRIVQTPTLYIRGRPVPGWAEPEAQLGVMELVSRQHEASLSAEPRDGGPPVSSSL